jgi:large subunit ribosomal protein L6
MSRVGKQLIEIPSGVEVKITDDLIMVKGPKGELSEKIHPQVTIAVADGAVTVKVDDETNKFSRSLWGLFASLTKNMIIGVTEGYSKQLEINGVGFKATVAGKKLTLNVGFSHPVEFDIPDGIEIKVDGNNIDISGIDKQLVGEVAAQIRKVKKPEPYKGKGIRYSDEQVRRKAGKAAAAKEA